MNISTCVILISLNQFMSDKITTFDYCNQVEIRQTCMFFKHFLDVTQNMQSVNNFVYQSDSKIVRESGVSCNSFCSNSCSLNSVEYLKLLLISSGNPLDAFEKDFQTDQRLLNE